MLTVDHGDATDFENRQREETFRSVLSWDHFGEGLKLSAKGGYIHTWVAYDYKRDLGNGIMAHMTHSRSKINTFYGLLDADYHLGTKWLFTGNLSLHQHIVESRDKNILRQDGNKAIVGYLKGRPELSGSLSAKWRPVERIGLSVVVREEMFGKEWTPIIPAFFVDGVLSQRGNIMAKASVSRNFRFPSLNDLYFLPGGNPDLKKESGWTYDAGLSFAVGKEGEPAADSWNIVGSLCSMNDIMAKQVPLPEVSVGDTLCFENTGAYCMTEGISLFLSRDIPAVWLIRTDGTRVCVRETFETAVLNTPKA
jgi:iron complex outermembrane receptor protein